MTAPKPSPSVRTSPVLASPSADAGDGLVGPLSDEPPEPTKGADEAGAASEASVVVPPLVGLRPRAVSAGLTTPDPVEEFEGAPAVADIGLEALGDVEAIGPSVPSSSTSLGAQDTAAANASSGDRPMTNRNNSTCALRQTRPLSVPGKSRSPKPVAGTPNMFRNVVYSLLCGSPCW